MALFRKKTVEKSIDQENLPLGVGASKNALKENLHSERRHLAPKRALGEVKNILHNSGIATPMKAMKNQIYSSSPSSSMLKNISKNGFNENIKLEEKNEFKTPRAEAQQQIQEEMPKSKRQEKQYDDGLNPIFFRSNPFEFDHFDTWSQCQANKIREFLDRCADGGNDDDLLLPLPKDDDFNDIHFDFPKIHLPEIEKPILPPALEPPVLEPLNWGLFDF